MEGMNSNFSLLGMWATMNWVAKGVVVVLALMSIWSLTIAIERLIRFQRAKRESLGIALGVTPLLKQHKLEEAITLASDKRYRHSHLARVLRGFTLGVRLDVVGKRIPVALDAVQRDPELRPRDRIDRHQGRMRKTLVQVLDDDARVV